MLQGPFDGVLGFSQGASMVSLLCAMQAQQATGDKPGSPVFTVGYGNYGCTQFRFSVEIGESGE